MYPVNALRAGAAAPPRTYYPGLDALRGLAVLSVVFFHFFPTNLLFSFGWMGVDFFFVISGFLITSILLQSVKEQGFFKNFYTRRLLRIIPLCFALLLAFFLATFFFDRQSHLTFYKQNWWYYFLFLQNWLFVAKGLPQEYYLNHFWSLAVEEQFYLVYPLLVFVVSKQRLVRITLFLIPVVMCLRTTVWFFNPDDFAKYYCSTFTRLDSLLFGCLLGCGVRLKKDLFSLVLVILSFGVLAAGIAVYQTTSFKNPVIATVGFSLIAFLFYAFLSFYTSNTHRLPLLRNSPLLNYIGKISYGIYLIHVPVYLVVTAVCAKLFGALLNELLIGSLSLPLTLLLSSASYFRFERHFLRLKIYFTNQPAAVFANMARVKSPFWYRILPAHWRLPSTAS